MERGDAQGSYHSLRLAAKRREQTPQALARLTVVSLFIAMWVFLWAIRIPMPRPFLTLLCAEAVFFLIYWRGVFLMPSARMIVAAYWCMLATEIVFHTTMVYFLGGASWLGSFAYVFGVVFTNAFLDIKQSAIYTTGATLAFAALILLDATGVIPHYAYMDQGAARYADPRFVATTILTAIGVLFSISAWVNWVGHQLRQERNAAVRMQDELERARDMLEDRVRARTSELQHANGDLSASHELLRATIESTADGILVVDGDGRVAYHNARFARLWRVPDEVLAAQDAREILAFVLDQVDDPEAFVAKVYELHETTRESLDTLEFKDGRVFERFSRPLMRAGDAAGRVWSFRDVTERKRAEEILDRRARYDSLTSTLNHASITDALRDMSARRDEASGGGIAVFMVDVDGMKSVNDVYGHQVGDAVLVEVARILDQPGALVGRYGGDEFLVVMAVATRAEAEAYGRRTQEAIAHARVADEQTAASIPIVASLGLALFPEEAETVSEAIRLADHAMYAAKREQGRPTTRTAAGDERAARMVGEIVPLLTSPGQLSEKLRLVAHRLSVGAGYDVVRFNIPRLGEGAGATTTFARLPDELVNRWNRERPASSGDAMTEELYRTRRPILIPDIESSGAFDDARLQILRAAGVKAALIVPMIWQDGVIGALSVASRREGALDARDVQFLTAVASQVTAIVQMETLVGDLQDATTHLQEARADTVVLLAAAAEAHDQTTGRHLHRVRTISEALAAELGYGDGEIDAIGLAATLHDIGKMRVPEAILLSPGQLGDDEWAIMKQHTLWGAEFLAHRPGFEMAAAVAAAHHERWDGTGYPRGLTGDQIPEVAAIVSVADSLDAITNDRPYRVGRPIAWAVDEIVACDGRQFSPRVVEALVRLHARGGLAALSDDGHEESAAA